MTASRLLLVGNPVEFHLGAHFRRGAETLGLVVEMFDTEEAFAGPAALVKVNWWFRGHRPTRLATFGELLVSACRRNRPEWVLSTGIAPLNRRTMDAIGALRIQRLNFLTDDPWNRRHRAPWFMKQIGRYDSVFSPRRANMEDLRRHGCRDVRYLPFGFDPGLHRIERASPDQAQAFEADVLFAGGADADRLPWITALIHAGFKVALYGGYWDRHAETKPFHLGHADLPTLRKATTGAKMVLGLVRRANRDGHAMRSFEVPAMGGCLLSEDTAEHREIFGPEGECTVYFRDEAEMLKKARWLLEHDAERRRLASAAHTRITGGGNTYADRLKVMLGLVGSR